MEKTNPRQKLFRSILIRTICAILFVLILLVVWIIGYVLAVNLNQDNVKLNDKTWTLIFSFTTIKNNVKVKLFARKGPAINTGEFVVVRNGSVPFLQLISPIFKTDSVWETQPIYPFKGMAYGTFELLKVNIGYYAYLSNRRYWLTPSLDLLIPYDITSKTYSFYGIQYVDCDRLPVFSFFKSKKEFAKYDERCKNPEIHNNPLNVLPRR